MSSARVLAIAGRIITQFRHDRRTLALLFVVPIFVMALVGYLIAEDKEPIRVALVAADQGASSPRGRLNLGVELGREIARQKSIETLSYASPGLAERDTRDGKVLAAVILPRDLTARMLAHRPAAIVVAVKGTDQAAERIAQAAVARASSVFAQRAPADSVAEAAPFSIEVRTLQARTGLSNVDFFAPALIVGFAFFFTFLLTSVSFLRERASGTMERLFASPATRVEIMLGYLLGFLVFALIQSFLVMFYAVVVLHVEVAGSLGLTALILAVLVVGTVNLGIALSFLARNELQVIQFIPIVLIPQFFLGGLVWPVETLHPALRAVAQVMPLTHAVAALREIMLGGAGFADIQGRFYVLSGFALLMAAFGAESLRRQQG